MNNLKNNSVNTAKDVPKKPDKLNYVNEAEEIIQKLPKDEKGKICLTLNKIRNILSLVNELYNMAQRNREEKLDENIQSHCQYVKMKLAYEAGRDSNVKKFIKQASIFNYIDGIGNSRENLINFCHYVEALVAYHKFYTKEKDI